jgi:hypothetical protein
MRQFYATTDQLHVFKGKNSPRLSDLEVIFGLKCFNFTFLALRDPLPQVSDSILYVIKSMHVCRRR